jgi:hypothetical protein
VRLGSSVPRMARQEGLEPPTNGFGDRYSTIELLASVGKFCRIRTITSLAEGQGVLSVRGGKAVCSLRSEGGRAFDDERQENSFQASRE